MTDLAVFHAYAMFVCVACLALLTPVIIAQYLERIQPQLAYAGYVIVGVKQGRYGVAYGVRVGKW